jgi:hypothetical protein
MSPTYFAHDFNILPISPITTIIIIIIIIIIITLKLYVFIL